MRFLLLFLKSIYAPPNDEDMLNLSPRALAKLKSSKVEKINPCPSGWEYDGETSCLKVYSPGKTWNEAKAHCEKFESELAVPTGHETMDTILNLPGNNKIWIGVKLEENANPNHVKYSEWHVGSENMNDQCVKIMNVAGEPNLEDMRHWSDVNYAPGWKKNNCDEPLDFLCKTHMNKTESGCKEGWSADPYGNCYKLSVDLKTWKDAQCACNKQGGNLAKVTNRYYDHLLRDVRDGRTGGIWIGYSRAEESEGLVPNWLDVEGKALDYTAWHPTQPNNRGLASCAQLFDVGTGGPFASTFAYPAYFVPGWVDQECDVRQYYLCQYEVGREEVKECSSAAPLVSTIIFTISSLLIQRIMQ